MHFSQTGCRSSPEKALEGAEGEQMTVDWTKVAVRVVRRSGRIPDTF